MSSSKGSSPKFTRRESIGITGAFLAGCTARGQERATLGFGAAAVDQVPERAEPRVRRAPGDELVNTLEFEEQARLVLPAEIHAEIAGGDREPFDRLTFRPRMNTPTLDMDLSVKLLGQTLFTPVLVGPIAQQARYHADGELATASGAAAAHALMVVSNRSSVPFERMAAEADTPLWYGVYAGDEGAGQHARAAAAAGAGAVFITVGESHEWAADSDSSAPARQGIDWRVIDSIRNGLDVPVVIKGVMSAEDAAAALEQGADGIVVSNGRLREASVAPMDVLTSIADEVAGRMPILIDGSFRRGTDVLKALILGAQAVLLGRPIAWGLAAYGADGVQWVVQLVQNELARCFAMLGASTPAQLTRANLTIHQRASS